MATIRCWWQRLLSTARLFKSKIVSHPKVFLGGVILLVAAGGGGSVFFWGWYHLQAAQRAVGNYRFQEARQHLNRCLFVWPSSFRGHLLAARVCRAQGDFEEARKHLSACVHREGRTEDVELEWTLLGAHSGDFPELEFQLRKLIDDGHARSTLILETMVSCLFKEARYRLAHHYLEAWLKAEPGNSMAYFWRGLVREKLEAPQEARNDYSRSLELDPGRWEARLQLVRLLFASKDFDGGRAHLSILNETQPRHPDVLLLLGIDCVQKGRLPEAEEYFAAVIDIQADSPVALYRRGELELQKGRPLEAETWFRKALTVDPNLSVVRYSLYMCLQQQRGRQQNAAAELALYKQDMERGRRLEQLLEKVEKQPKNSQLLVEAGELFLEKRQVSVARQYLQRALQTEPNNKKAQKLLADSFKGPESQPLHTSQ
jgi:tetratricopeptide (TPR) repeat protein